jgi:hypothetical protein
MRQRHPGGLVHGRPGSEGRQTAAPGPAGPLPATGGKLSEASGRSPCMARDGRGGTRPDRYRVALRADGEPIDLPPLGRPSSSGRAEVEAQSSSAAYVRPRE